MKYIYTILTWLLVYPASQAQPAEPIYPVIGKPCPDFSFSDVHYYKNKKITLKDFKGQWLILDCWNRYCSVCLHKMPEIDSLQSVFAGQVKFLLVGYTGSQYTKRSDDKPIRKLYDMNRDMERLSLSIAYDSVLFHRFKIGACPYIIVIDPNGIVRGITWSLTAKDINNLLTGTPVKLPRAYRKGEF